MATTSRGSKYIVSGLIFLLLGGAGVGIGVWGLSVAWDTRDWEEVRAEVISVDQETYTYRHHRSGGGSDEEGQRLRCTFAFTVDGERYTSDRYSRLEAWDEYTQGEASIREMNEQLAVLATGSVTAYYNPSDPTEAVLVLPETVPPTMLLVAGLILLMLCLRSLVMWRKSRSNEGSLEPTG